MDGVRISQWDGGSVMNIDNGFIATGSQIIVDKMMLLTLNLKIEKEPTIGTSHHHDNTHQKRTGTTNVYRF